ncbi:hypothetical protein [Kordiimonas aestuarii]|uniref:hypothetical protein n=1 Tax=Kordiimonas aestuarii TaxID=1005925 RepID=UPI0021D00E03|nr:hypothetical protein [Kordiimonas aestuarii]
MAHHLLTALVTATTLLLAQAAGAEPQPTNDGPKAPYHVFATDWGLTLKSDGTGFYNDLAQLIFAPEIGAVNYEILPYRRAKRHFFEQLESCLYPSSTEYLTATGDIQANSSFIGSPSILTNKIHIFAPHGSPAPTRFEDINGKRVAYAMGSRIPYALKGTTALFIAVADEVDKAEMLLSGRVDLITAAMPDVKFVFDSLGVETAPYDPDLVIAGSGIGVVCHNTPENELFLSRVTERLTALKKNGRLATFLRDQELIPEDYITPD